MRVAPMRVFPDNGDARAIARELGMGSRLSCADIGRLRIEIARLTAGLDPHSGEDWFKFGVAFALSATLNAIVEQIDPAARNQKQNPEEA